jgi:hypothetical protein
MLGVKSTGKHMKYRDEIDYGWDTKAYKELMKRYIRIGESLCT